MLRISPSFPWCFSLIPYHYRLILQVRLQTQSTTNPIYSGLGDCVRKTYAAEGFGGFYKGVASPLYGQMFLNAWQFGVWGNAKKLVQDKDGKISTAGFFAAGAFTGALVALVECPVDLFKTQLQTQVFKAKPDYTTFFGCFTSILKTYGIRGAMQGLTPTILRNTIAVAQYFGFYELTKQYLATGDQYEKGTLETWKLMIAGAVGGLFYWPVIYPLDCIKSAMQADNLVVNRKYPNMLACYKTLLAEGGVGRLFSGFAPCMIRSVPANAVCFTGYELTVKFLGGEEDPKPQL